MIKRIQYVVVLALLACAQAQGQAGHGGDGSTVDTSVLPPLPDDKSFTSNPYRGNKAAIEVGTVLYGNNCARCHGLRAISGGFTPDLRELGPEWDAYYLTRVETGFTRNGAVKMPPFKDVLSQEKIWAIRSYLDERHYELEGKDLSALYEQAGADDGEDQPSDEAEAAVPQKEDAPGKMEEIEQAGSIEIAIYQDFPPWSYPAEDGGHTGIDVAIAEALADKLGVELSLYPFRHDESMDDDIRNRVWKGHYMGRPPSDAMIHVGMAPAFQKNNDQASFVAAYYNETMGLAYDAERFGKDVNSPLALAGYTIGAKLDTLGAFYLSSAFGGALREDVRHFLSVPEAMQALNEGKIAGVVAPVGELRGAAYQLDEKKVAIKHIKLTGMYQTDWDVGVAIKAGNPRLAAALNQAMAELRSSGALQKIFEDHGVLYRPPTGADGNATESVAAE